MPDYRFATPIRQTNYVDFGLAIGAVCEHLRAWGFTISSIRVKAGRLTITVDQTIPADNLAHLDLEAG